MTSLFLAAAEDAIVKTIGDIYNEEFSDYDDTMNYEDISEYVPREKKSCKTPSKTRLANDSSHPALIINLSILYSQVLRTLILCHNN